VTATRLTHLTLEAIYVLATHLDTYSYPVRGDRSRKPTAARSAW